MTSEAPAVRIACAGQPCYSADMQEHRGTIVVVEDDSSLNQAVGRLFEAAGFRARLFASAEAVLADGALHEADCFVLDVHLPGLSGFELCSHLRCNGIRAPLILITAHDDPMHQRTAREIGIAAYLTKPFGSAALVNAVVCAMAAAEAT
jgi:two-component system response regulator FixJ